MKAELKISRKILITIAATLILLGALSNTTYDTAQGIMAATYSGMTSSLSTFENKINRAMNIENMSEAITDEVIKGIEYTSRITFEETGDIQQVLNYVSGDGMWTYYIDVQGKIYKSSGAEDLKLSDSQIKELVETGTLLAEEGEKKKFYATVEKEHGTMVACFLDMRHISWESAVTGLSDRFHGYVADKSDGRIFYSSDASLVGTSAPTGLTRPIINIEKKCRSKFSNYKSGFTNLNKEKAYCIECETDKYIFGIYYESGKIIGEVIKSEIPVAVVLIGGYIIILAFFFILWKDSDKREKKWVRVFNTGLYFEASQVSHLSCFVLFVTIITLLFNAHYVDFTYYSMQSNMASQNLDILAENIEASDKDRQRAVELMEEYLSPLADQLANLMAIDEDIVSHESLKDFAENCYISEVSVYDSEGYLEASSGDYTGYQLTTNENDDLYQAWEVLKEDKNSLFKECGDESGKFIMAQRRKDSPGIICFRYENPEFTDMLKYYSKVEAIKGTDFGNATTFFVKLEDESNNVYVIEPFSTVVNVLDVNIPEEVRQDKYSGIANIGSDKSYVNTRVSSGISVTSAISCELIDTVMLLENLFLLIAFALMMLVLFLGCMCIPEKEDGETESENQQVVVNPNRSVTTMFADSQFKRMTKYFYAVVIIAYCIMMLKKNYQGETLVEFIFGGTWEKGFNLFAINASVIVAVIVVLGIFLLDKLIKFLGSSNGPKGISLANITSSIMKFIGLFFIFMHTLYQFGVNTTALLASAGLAGMVIGIAAKDIFSDLIAGLFLIFEGNIKVGDFVKFKDFKGTVTEIGARVTVLKRYNNKLIVNNSDLKQYYRLSDELSGAWVEIDVGPNEDPAKIEELIRNSEEWYKSKIRYLMGGPWFSNVSHFDSSSITICLFGSCIEENVSVVKREIILRTLELFRANGITAGKDIMKIEMQMMGNQETDNPP